MQPTLEAITAVCTKCQTETHGKYCAHCGTPLKAPRFTMHSLGHQLVHDLHLVEQTFLKLTLDLVVRPGRTLGAILDRRKSYMGPLSYYLTSAALFAFAAVKAGYFKITPTGNQSQVTQSMQQIMQMLGDQSKAFSLVSLPVLAFFTWVMFRKQRLNYAEHLVLNLLIGGAFNVVWLFTFLPLFLVWRDPQANSLLFEVVMAVYMGIAFRYLFGQSWVKSIVKAALAMLFFSLALGTIMLIIAMTILAKNGGQPGAH